MRSLLLLTLCCAVGCTVSPLDPSQPAAVHLDLAHDLQVAFQPEANRDSLQALDGWRRLDNGRLLVKTFDGVTFDKETRAELALTLRSAGDPWDKLGAVVVWRDSPEVAAAIAAGEAPSMPGVELLRFITPFGVGHFSDMPRADEYRPVYVPAWADSVHWTADVTPMLPWLERRFHLAFHVDTWSDAGQILTSHLRLTPSPAQRHDKLPRALHPILNTVKFFADQDLFTGFADGPVATAFAIDAPLEDAELHLVTTGHGGHAAGDEFIPREHVVQLDGQEIARFTPWRDDCASFRRLNPSSGVWMERTFWRGDSLDERIASSDLSRSGWCPGSNVPARRIPLGTLAAGSHQLTVHIPEAQAYSDTAQNFFNVAAWVTGLSR